MARSRSCATYALDYILAVMIGGLGDGQFGVSRRSDVAPCCALDEGRSLGAVLQEEASNRHERLLPNGDGRERHG